jgi:hypothetical protein
VNHIRQNRTLRRNCFDEYLSVSQGHHTNAVRLETIADTVDTVKALIEIQEKTLERRTGLVMDTLRTRLEILGGRAQFMKRLVLAFGNRRLAGCSTLPVAFIHVNLLLFLSAIPIPSYALGRKQDQQKEPLGSLTGVGQVYLNDAPAMGEFTIFSGDRVRTGPTGTATFTISGKGTLKISPQSQIVFSGAYQFTADLEAGTIVLNTNSGPNGLTLRIGNYVVVSNSRKQLASLRVTRAPDGSVQVSCLDGTAGVLTLEGQVGQFLQAGQSINISASSYFSPSSASSTVKSAENSHKGWLLLGLGGGGAAAAAALLLRGGSAQSISPSGP